MQKNSTRSYATLLLLSTACLCSSGQAMTTGRFANEAARAAAIAHTLVASKSNQKRPYTQTLPSGSPPLQPSAPTFTHWRWGHQDNAHQRQFWKNYDQAGPKSAWAAWPFIVALSFGYNLYTTPSQKRDKGDTSLAWIETEITTVAAKKGYLGNDPKDEARLRLLYFFREHRQDTSALPFEPFIKPIFTTQEESEAYARRLIRGFCSSALTSLNNYEHTQCLDECANDIRNTFLNHQTELERAQLSHLRLCYDEGNDKLDDLLLLFKVYRHALCMQFS